jgi:hypothetical protein
MLDFHKNSKVHENILPSSIDTAESCPLPELSLALKTDHDEYQPDNSLGFLHDDKSYSFMDDGTTLMIADDDVPVVFYCVLRVKNTAFVNVNSMYTLYDLRVVYINRCNNRCSRRSLYEAMDGSLYEARGTVVC